MNLKTSFVQHDNFKKNFVEIWFSLGMTSGWCFKNQRTILCIIYISKCEFKYIYKAYISIITHNWD